MGSSKRQRRVGLVDIRRYIGDTIFQRLAMKITVRPDPKNKDAEGKKINFVMHDVFNEKAIVHEARKMIKTRWPNMLKGQPEFKWEY